MQALKLPEKASDSSEENCGQCYGDQHVAGVEMRWATKKAVPTVNEG
jgi:hypothetical protein